MLRVCVVDPDERQLDVYAPNERLRTLDAASTLDLTDILPGFSLRVGQLFE